MRFKIPHKYNIMPLSHEDVCFFRKIYTLELKKQHWDGGLPYGTNQKRDEYKKRIKDYLKKEQNGCCAYCGFDFETRGESHRDHIAPKALYPEFLFRPDNLILSCPVCNGLDMKKNADTIVAPVNKRYKSCNFSIVHPYFDDFNDHITYIPGSSGILV